MRVRWRELLPLSLLALSACKAPDVDPASIGIIGGADGPTAIYVITNIPKYLLYTLIGIVAAAIAGIVVWLCRKK